MGVSRPQSWWYRRPGSGGRRWCASAWRTIRRHWQNSGLVELHDAYALAKQADELVAEGRHDRAASLYREASERAPDNHELRFWAGVGAAQAGDVDVALEHFRAAIAMQPGWRELLSRIPPELAPGAASVLAQLGGNGTDAAT